MKPKAPPPRVFRPLPAVTLVFCSKCGCHYSDRCPTHNPKPESEPPARPERTTWPAGIYTTRSKP